MNKDLKRLSVDINKPKPVVWREDSSARLNLFELSGPKGEIQHHVPGYKLLTPIAAGSSGEVFIARSKLDGTNAAIKIFHKSLIPNEEAMARFGREVETLKKLSHPNIVKILGYGTTEESAPFIGMELVDGLSIKTLLETESVFEPRRAALIAREICRALDAAHARSFIHRDLKPSNIVIDSQDVAKIVDFGIAKAAGSCNDTITEYGSIIGTPSYMSPEQCLGQRVDRRSDIYSLGCTLFEMLTGTKAFEAASAVHAIAQHIDVDRSHIKMLLRATDAPIALQSIVIKCLEREPAHRYATAVELDHDLSSFLLDLPLKFALNRYTALKIGAGFLAALIVVAAGVANFHGNDPQVQRGHYFNAPSTNRPRRIAWHAAGPPPTTIAFSPDATLSRPHIDIYNRSSRKIVFSDPYAKNLKEAIKNASVLHISLAQADLHNADLTGATINDVDLSFADLTGAKLMDSTLTGVDLHGATLTQANLTQATLTFVNLQDAKLNLAILVQTMAPQVMLNGADLSSSQLRQARLEGSSCTKANFAKAELNWTHLDDADCTGANFEGANLEGTQLIKATCVKANFHNTKMIKTNLQGADLSEVSLARAQPVQAWLQGANLSHTDLGANHMSRLEFLDAKPSEIEVRKND